MTSWEQIANLRVEEESLVGMRDRVKQSLENGSDPGPEVALALLDVEAHSLRLAVALRESLNFLEEELTATQLYVLELETRLAKAGLRFDDASARITTVPQSED